MDSRWAWEYQHATDTFTVSTEINLLQAAYSPKCCHISDWNIAKKQQTKKHQGKCEMAFITVSQEPLHAGFLSISCSKRVGEMVSLQGLIFKMNINQWTQSSMGTPCLNIDLYHRHTLNFANRVWTNLYICAIYLYYVLICVKYNTLITDKSSMKIYLYNPLYRIVLFFFDWLIWLDS